MQSSLDERVNPEPNEIVSEIIRNQNPVSMCYVLESQPMVYDDDDEMYSRFFNIFVVDSYESFR